MINSKILITIGRQLGSGGLEVAHKLSKSLDIEVFDRKLLSIAATESGLDESLFEKRDEKPISQNSFARFFGVRNSNYHDPSNYLNTSITSDDGLFELQSHVIREIAQNRSGIFVGRCADYILRDMPGLLTVFISADMDDRIARISTRNNISPEEARRVIEQGDKRRSAYYGYYSFKTWGDAASYDLCINSSRFGVDKIVDTIISML